MITFTFTHFTLFYIFFSVAIYSNDTLHTVPHRLAYANAKHYAISLLALTSLGFDKISLFDYDLGGGVVMSCQTLSLSLNLAR